MTSRRAGRARPLDTYAGPLDGALALLFEEPSAGRMVIDRHGRVVRASERLRCMAACSRDLSPGTPASALFAAAERDPAWAEVAAVLAGGRSARPVRALLAGPAGAAPLAVSLTCTVLPGAEGAPAGLLLAAQDVSAQTRLEAQLAQSQRLQMAGQLAGGIAHDFNNLLTAMRGGADAIAVRGGLDEASLDDIETIRASVARGAALVRQLLAFGGPPTLRPRVLAVNTVVADIAAMLRRLLGSNLRLNLALQSPGRLVRMDPTALDQVLVNLAVNARDAMPDGGTLTLHTSQLTLHRPLPRGADTIPPGSYVMIEVQDTGVGIAPDVLARMFERYFTTRRDAGGTGLGLSTVHGIVRQSDGFLAVESTPGRGTRLRVYLPAWLGDPAEARAALRPRAAVAQAVLPLLQTPKRSRGAVLLVEDEDVVRRVAERALVRQGWRVVAAPTAEAALDLLDDAACSNLSAVVSDLVLPGMDGAALIHAVRQRLGAPTLPALLVSGYTAEDLREKAAAGPGGGATQFLAKPYDIKDLAKALAELAR